MPAWRCTRTQWVRPFEKGISLRSAEAAVLGGVNKLSDYDTMLTTLGYDATDRATLEALLQAKAAAKNITLT